MRGKVLIVDDDDATREILSRYLAMDDYVCVTAPNVENAIRALDEGGFHVVVTDKNMPTPTGIEENGLALIRYVRQHYPEVGVIVITGFATIESAVEAMHLGAFDYIAKPFELEILRDKVDRIREYQHFLDPATAMNTYRILHGQMLDLFEQGGRTSSEQKQHFLELIQQKMDMIFDRYKAFERLLLYQRERLAEIASSAEQLRESIPENSPVYPLVLRIAEQASRRL